MAALLLFLVFLDTALTGYLLGQYRGIKRTVRGVARVQRDIAGITAPDVED